MPVQKETQKSPGRITCPGSPKDGSQAIVLCFLCFRLAHNRREGIRAVLRILTIWYLLPISVSAWWKCLIGSFSLLFQSPGRGNHQHRFLVAWPKKPTVLTAGPELFLPCGWGKHSITTGCLGDKISGTNTEKGGIERPGGRKTGLAHTLYPYPVTQGFCFPEVLPKRNDRKFCKTQQTKLHYLIHDPGSLWLGSGVSTNGRRGTASENSRLFPEPFQAFPLPAPSSLPGSQP